MARDYKICRQRGGWCVETAWAANKPAAKKIINNWLKNVGEGDELYIQIFENDGRVHYLNKHGESENSEPWNL